MNYEQCLKYLEKIQNLGIKFGLDNVKTILSSFGNPHEKYASLCVAGTNGKGSVCAMLTQVLSLHGFRVGLFTSPHLVQVEERICIGGTLIPARNFCRLLTVLKERIEKLIVSKKLLSPPTYFEYLTCLALLHFEEQKVDMAVLEVGMGGRFDATNVVTPCVSVITTISEEHQKFLGETLSQIAFEKAGIVKRGVPVVCGVEEDEAYETIKKRAEELQVPFFGVFERRGSYIVKKTKKGHSFLFQTKKEKYNFSPSLQGEHQGKNAAVAIAASEQLSKNWKKLDKKKIIEGIETTKWEGRLELVSRNPLIILDGAHNIEGAKALKKYINDFLPSKLILVFAIKRDKEITKIAEILFPLAEKIIITRFPYFKAASPEDIKAKAQGFQDRLLLEPDVNQAMNLALRCAGSDGCVLAAGSLFLVGEIKKQMGSRLNI
ncbi:MAG: bifunctional folylpolyglutamate synthase/dihydrofolate synthase [Candidatus Aminicenantes bacterium]|nr:bifunctional folylpolyglutamate synthase/dihydrofolate synthase [Candidatus Aminicenantes bacterium]